MLELKGKYNTTKVFTDNVDNETISQVIRIAEPGLHQRCENQNHA